MAERDDDIETNADAGKDSKKKMIIMIAVMAIMMGMGIVGTLYFSGVLEKKKEPEMKVEVKLEPIYFSFEKPFTVNFETESGLRFLQVGVDLMSHDPDAIEAVRTHIPVIKNNIILMFSNQTYATLVSREGKDTLREQTLKEIQTVLEKYYGKPGVEEVYFTSFVMQ